MTSLSRIFRRRGCTASKEWRHWPVRWTNFKSEYEEEGFISGGGGGKRVRTPCTLPLDPPLLINIKVWYFQGDPRPSYRHRQGSQFLPQNSAFWQVTQHGKFVSWQTGKFIFWSDHRSEGHHGHLLSYKEHLFTTHGYLPSPSYKTFFPDDASLNYLLSKVSGSKYMQLCRNHSHFESV